MTEDNKEDEEGISLGTLIFVGVVVMTVVVGLGIYTYVTAPYHTADTLRDYIDGRDVSDDYRQGWLDCVDKYIDIMTEATNCTR